LLIFNIEIAYYSILAKAERSIEDYTREVVPSC
jgi:hypothetical protein